MSTLPYVIPAQAGIQKIFRGIKEFWTPACAGATEKVQGSPKIGKRVNKEILKGEKEIFATLPPQLRHTYGHGWNGRNLAGMNAS